MVSCRAISVGFMRGSSLMFHCSDVISGFGGAIAGVDGVFVGSVLPFLYSPKTFPSIITIIIIIIIFFFFFFFFFSSYSSSSSFFFSVAAAAAAAFV
jgi:hypothetical protein